MVHECTRAAIPEFIQPSKKSKSPMTQEQVEALEREKLDYASEKALARGHASPREIGAFVMEAQPRRLVLNHFSAM